jgi:hypothetical protein
MGGRLLSLISLYIHSLVKHSVVYVPIDTWTAGISLSYLHTRIGLTLYAVCADRRMSCLKKPIPSTSVKGEQLK